MIGNLIVLFLFIAAIFGIVMVIIHLIKDKKSRKTFLLFFIIWLIIAAGFGIMMYHKQEPLENTIVMAIFGGLLFSLPVMGVIAIIQHFTSRKKKQ